MSSTGGKQAGKGRHVAAFSRAGCFRLDLFRETKCYWLFPHWTDVDMSKVAALREEWREAHARRVTYTAFVIKAVADSICELKARNPELNAAILGFPWKRMLYFDQVDVAVACEKRHMNEEYFYTGIIRNAEAQSLEGIAEQLARLAEDEGDGSFQETYKLARKPGMVRRLALWFSRNVPSLVKKYRGTVFLSSVGKYGVNGFAMTNHNVSFSFGKIEQRPKVVEERIEVRPLMVLTLVIDHRTINGGPAARLLARVKERLEAGDFALT